MTLFRYMYISRAVPLFGDADLEHLRLTAQDYNDQHDVVGLLVYDGIRFAQIVEGPERAIASVVDRIVRDHRHRDIQVASYCAVTQRRFRGWALRTCWRAEAEPESFVAQIKRLVDPCSDGDVRAFFIGFAAIACRDDAGLRSDRAAWAEALRA